MTELRATARLQLRREFGFDAAAAQVPYYAGLGISHLYLSPIATARPGSAHGYDVVDPTQVNPELGGEPALERLTGALRAHRMGAILDIVPNHMAADVANPWWHDVLANGRRSRYAAYFDIRWNAVGANGKLQLPLLPQPVDAAVSQSAVCLVHDAGSSQIRLRCGDQCLPLSLDSQRTLLDEAGYHCPLNNLAGSELANMLDRINADAAQLRQVLDQQHYRLSYWRDGNTHLNYRRFFDISSLVALAMERHEVFDAVHALPLRLVERGWIDGLRVDHVDGLSDPQRYLQRLRRAVDAAAQVRGAGPRITIHVEKILAHGEHIPAAWPIDGTTGYDFMSQVNAVLHAPSGAPTLHSAWVTCSGRPPRFETEELVARSEVLQNNLVAEMRACTDSWLRYGDEYTAAGFDYDELCSGLGLLLLHLRVYRTYPQMRAPDRAALQAAFDEARDSASPAQRRALEFLHAHMLPASEPQPSRAARTALKLARRRLEQTSAPLNAKAVEDRAFYRYGVLLSRNEVGSDPRNFSISVGEFHDEMAYIAKNWPRSLTCTATHDHKRGEDVRARLCALSENERAQLFVGAAQQWMQELVSASTTALPPGELWMLLQTIVGAWPLQLFPEHETKETFGQLQHFAGRIVQWHTKALRESGLHSNWLDPDLALEHAFRDLTERLLSGAEFARLRQSIADTAHDLDAAGALNGLVATTLRLTAPGVPDLYQGTERWDLSLVDPDNRRPVDYVLRRSMSSDRDPPSRLLECFRDGRIKQWMIARLLDLRAQHPSLFSDGSYEPIAIEDDDGSALAFLRRAHSVQLLVVVPIRCTHDMHRDALPVAAPIPAGKVVLDRQGASMRWRDVFTQQSQPSGQNQFALDRLLTRWPVAVLLSTSDDQ